VGSKEITDSVSFPKPTDPVLDVRTAVAHLGGSWDAYVDVAGAFLEQMQGVVAQLDGFGSHPPPAGLRDLVHEVGSSLAAVGAGPAYHQARAIEADLRRGQPVRAESLGRLRQAIDAAVAELRIVLSCGPVR
jgi:hypothetical protein